MAKFMVLYRAPVSPQEQMASASPEQAQAGMEAWMAWAGKAGNALVDFGSPVSTAGVVGSARKPGDEDFIGGYSIMEAESVDALKSQLEEHPHLEIDGATIEILEFLALPGM